MQCARFPNRKRFPISEASGSSSVDLNRFLITAVSPPMKTFFLPALILFALAAISPAQTCREVVRDSSGRIVQTIERHQQTGGTVRSVTRDASGRIIGTATTRSNSSGSAHTTYRDASGRLTGSASTQSPTSNSSRTTYRDASGRLTGSAQTSTAAGTSSRTQ